MTAKLLSLALLTSAAIFAQHGGYRSADPYGNRYGRPNRYEAGFDRWTEPDGSPSGCLIDGEKSIR